MTYAMQIPHTLGVITSCWDKAETELRKSVKKKYHDPDEEFITRLFCGEFSYALRKASERGLIKEAFLEDLRRAYPDLSYHSEIALIADNLIADVSLHKRHIEKFTGGDFGLTITRPDVLFNEPYYSHTGYLKINADYQRGLLCQAKLKQKTSSWGKFTTKQKKVLPERLRYLGLLLYECSGESRQQLKKFTWQLCNADNIDTVSGWLKSGKFPSLMSSLEIIQQLGAAKIGTDDKQILEQIIRPTGKPQFSIRVYWASDKRPPDSMPIMLYSSLRNPIEEPQRQRISIAQY